HHTLESVLAEIDAFLRLPIYFLSPSILTPDIGTTEYHRARNRDDRLRLLEVEGNRLSVRPRADVFGADMPYGLPTVCEHLSKTTLNDLLTLAQVEFFLRAEAVERLLRYTPEALHESARAWLQSVAAMAARLSAQAQLPA